MNWILASFLMFLSSALLYTLIRKGQKLQISTAVNSLAMFMIPVPLLFAYAQITHQSLVVTPQQLGLLFFSALAFSWLGNLFSLKSIEVSPNPGYSLIISKSYVVFTSIASVFLFDSKLSVGSLIGIGCIILFSAVIILADKKKEKEVHSLRWFWLALGSFFCFGGLALMSKYLLNQGVSVSARLFYVFLFVSFILLAEMKMRKEKIGFVFQNLPILFGIGVSGMLFNIFMQLGFQTAPNPGFVNAVNASSIVLVTLLSAYLFGDELNGKKLIGVIGVTVGLLLLFIT
jgi:drug/metabolite transporter (DMT)-like permease